MNALDQEQVITSAPVWKCRARLKPCAGVIGICYKRDVFDMGHWCVEY